MDAVRLPTRRGARLATALAVVLAVAGFGLRAWVAGHPVAELYASQLLIDDGFYSLSYARELADGRPFHVAPGQPGNGFQPLWVLLTAPIYLAVDDDWVAVRLCLLLAAALAAMTSWLLFRWVRDAGGGPSGGLLAAALWSFSPVAVSHGLNGLETALAASVLAAIGAFWGRLRARPAALGALLAVSVLARVDALVAVPVVAMAVWRRRSVSDAFRFGAVFALVAAPWFLWSALSLGRTLPESGAATRQLTRLLAGADPTAAVAPAVAAANAAEASRALLGETARHLAPALDPSDPAPWVWLPTAAFLAFLLAAASRARRRDVAGLSAAWPAATAAAAAVATYVVWVGGSWFYPRYFQPVVLLATVLAGWIAGRVLDRSPRLTAVLPAALACYVVAGLAAVGSRATTAFPEFAQPRWIPYVERQVAAGHRLGAMQSGLLGYATRGGVRNLDGVVDGGARRALADGSFHRHLRSEGIEEVLDWSRLILLGPARRSDPARIRFEPVRQDVLVAYRLVWPDLDATASGTADADGVQRISPTDPVVAAGHGWGRPAFEWPELPFVPCDGAVQHISWRGPPSAGSHRVELRLRVLREGSTARIRVGPPGATTPPSIALRTGHVTVVRTVALPEPGARLELELSHGPERAGCRLYGITVSPG